MIIRMTQSNSKPARKRRPKENQLDGAMKKETMRRPSVYGPEFGSHQRAVAVHEFIYNGISMNINEYVLRVRKINDDNGWNIVTKKDWKCDSSDRYKIPSLLALIHSEINEAHDELFGERFNELATEMADIEIRVLDLGGGLVSDFQACVAFAWETGVEIPDGLDRAFIHMHKYVTAALEYYRDDESGLFIGELAKLYIFNRCFAIHKFKLNIDQAVHDKLVKNEQRSFRHGGKRV